MVCLNTRGLCQFPLKHPGTGASTSDSKVVAVRPFFMTTPSSLRTVAHHNSNINHRIEHLIEACCVANTWQCVGSSHWPSDHQFHLMSLTNCRPNKEGKNPRPAWNCAWPPATPPTPPPSVAAAHPPPTPRPGTKAFGDLGLSTCGRSASGRLGTLSCPVRFVLQV